MSFWTLESIKALLGGSWLARAAQGSVPLAGVAIDSRLVKPGNVFLAMKGERVDGHAYLAAFTGRPDPSQSYQTVFAKESFLNPGKVDPAPGRAEAQIQSQAVESLAERKVALAKLQRIVAENGLMVPIVVQYDVQAMSEKVQGYKPNLLGKPKFENVWIKA